LRASVNHTTSLRGARRATWQSQKAWSNFVVPPEIASPTTWARNDVLEALDANLKSTVHQIKDIALGIIELIIKSPLAAKNYKAGQIFRLQNFALQIENTSEPIALSPYEVDRKTGLISFLIAKAGNSTKLCSKLKKNDEVALMGPVGSALTPSPSSASAILVGLDIRNLALLPLAKELKSQGNKVIFLAHYTKTKNRLYADKIEKVADKVIWSCDGGLLTVNRKQDQAIEGDVIKALKTVIPEPKRTSALALSCEFWYPESQKAGVMLVAPPEIPDSRSAKAKKPSSSSFRNDIHSTPMNAPDYIRPLRKLISADDLYVDSVLESSRTRVRSGSVLRVSSKSSTINEFPKRSIFASPLILYLPDKTLSQIKTTFATNNTICNLLLPMQCMMKGICGQCITKTNDKEGYIFACSNSEYTLDKINPQIIKNRLKQNSLLEKFRG